MQAVKYTDTVDAPNTALTRTVTFTVNDGALNSNTQTRNITVTPVNDPPVLAAIEGAALAYTENAAATPITGTLTVGDPDSATLASGTVSITAGFVSAQDTLGFTNVPATMGNIAGVYTPGTGVMALTSAGASATLAQWQAALRAVTYVNSSDNPTVSRTITFTVNDGALNSNNQTRTITITPVNDPPVLAAIEGATLAATEQVAIAITSAITVNDVDSPTLASGTVAITSNYLSAEDLLSFINNPATMGNIAGVFTPGTGVMALTSAGATATLAQWQAALQAVKYTDTVDAPNTALTRTVTFTVNDGALNSNTQTRNITVTAVNDAPVVTAPGPFPVTPNIRISIPAPGLLTTVNDPDGATTSTVTSGSIATTQGGTVTVNTATGAFTYDPPAGFAGPSDTFNYQVMDNGTPGTATSTAVTVTLNFSGPVVWFADAAAAAGGDGTLFKPFQTLAAANTAANAATHSIFLVNGAYTGGITLTSGVKLFGQGVTGANFDTVVLGGAAAANSIARPAIGGTAPVITTVVAATNGINLTAGAAVNNTLRGFTIGNTTGAKIASGANFGTLTVGEVTLNGTGQALGLSSGALAATFLSITSTSSASQGISLSSVTGAMTSTAGTTISGNASQGILVSGSTADINFGNTSVTGGTNGVSLQNNSAGTRTFGTLAIINSTGAGNPAFLHAVGGGLTVAGVTTITNPAGTGIDIQSSTTLITFGGTTIDKSGTAGIGVNLGGVGTGNSGGVTFGSLAITASNGSGLVGAENSGTITVTTNTGSISATSGPAINITKTSTSTPLAMAFANVSSTTSGTQGINLLRVSGTLTTTGGALSGAAGSTFNVNTSTANITYAGSITGSAGQHSVNISGETAGTIALSGAIGDTGTGISLSSNTGATINFSGTITASTGANTAFNATGGGTVSATNAASTLTTTTGTALNVTNTTIGASGLIFKSISANGGANGIVLNTTGASGGLTVNGDGANTSVGGNSTGGTIQNMSGANGTSAGVGIYLNSTASVVLRRMTITGTNQNHGIRGFSVSGFTLEYSTISGTNGVGDFNTFPDDSGEGCIYFGNTVTTGIIGSGTFTNNNISGGAWDNMHIENTSGTATITVKGNTFGLNGSLANGANISMLMMAHNSGTVLNAVVGGPAAGEPNTFTGAPGGLANFTGQTATTMDVQFKNNVMSNSHPNNNVGGGCLTLASQGVMTFVADSNSMRDADGSTVTLQKASAGTSLTGKFTNNTLGVTGIANSASKSGNGIFLSCAGAGTIGLTITGNSIRNWNGNAAMFFDNTGGSYAANFTITGNTMAEPDANSFASLALTNGGNLTSDTVNVCAVIGGAGALKNTITGTAALADLYLGSSGQNGGHTFNLPGYAGASNLINVQNFVIGNNTFSGGATVSAYDDNSGQGSFTGVGAGCGTPLMFAAGGVEADSAAKPKGDCGCGHTRSAQKTDAQIAAETANDDMPPMHSEPMIASRQTESVTQPQLDILVAAARARWEATELSDAQRATLGTVKFEVATLSGGRLGEAGAGVIRVDATAGGNGWFIDGSPAHDVQFVERKSATRFYKTPQGAAAGRIDLLPALMHEMGHAIGLADTYDPALRDSIMYGFLTKGERRLPAMGQAATADRETGRLGDKETRGAQPLLLMTEGRAVLSKEQGTAPWHPACAYLALAFVLMALHFRKGARIVKRWTMLLAFAISALGLSAAHAADTVTLDIPALPAGKQLVITFDAAVAKPVSPGTLSVSTQGTISGTNFASVLTDDPSTVAANDPTVLAIVNTPPVLSSALTAVPNPAIAGQPVQFGAAVSDADLDVISYLWDFKDGSTSTSQNPLHPFAIPGTYVVSLNINDGRGGTASGSISVEIHSGILGEGDADGDGFLDEIEGALGSDPFNPNSRPLNLPMPTATAAISFPNLHIHLDFAQTKKDSILLTGHLPVNGIFPVGQVIIVDVGGVVKAFVLNAAGNSPSGVPDRVMLKIKSPVVQPSLRRPNFTMKLKKGSFASALADEQLTSAPASKAPRTVNVTIIFLNTVFKGSVSQLYTVKNSVGTTTMSK